MVVAGRHAWWGGEAGVCGSGSEGGRARARAPARARMLAQRPEIPSRLPALEVILVEY